MPLLVQSLSCEEQSLKLSTLQTMYSLVLDAPEIITRHVTSLVPMLLGLSKCQMSMVIYQYRPEVYFPCVIKEKQYSTLLSTTVSSISSSSENASALGDLVIMAGLCQLAK